MAQQQTMFEKFEKAERTLRTDRKMQYQDTSRKAWIDFVHISAELDFAICKALDAASTNGLADHEIEERIGRTHQAVSANRRHLVERGIVCQTKLRGKTKSGRSCILWVLADHYVEAIHGNG